MVRVESLSKVFQDRKRGEVRAVEGVSFDCRPGEIFGLLGPNGAGKTTLIRILATILRPTSGAASVGGYDVGTAPEEVRRRLGYLTGSASLYERLTAREVVQYFAELHGMDRVAAGARIEEVFSTLEIHPFADRRCDRLSTGQRQRVSIARAILHEPPILLFDEPTSGLDVLAARNVVRFIRRFRDEGRTILFSTHVMSEVEALCDRIAIIYQGRIAAIGTVDELRERTGERAFENVFLRLIGEAV